MKDVSPLIIVAGLMVVHASCDHSSQANPVRIDGTRPIEFRVIDDNLVHDTLLIQTTFDLGDGSFVMVASNREDTWEGLRLYRYRLATDSTPEMLAVSAPAYDSWTMLPTFFSRDSALASGLWVLANFGERESWGQKFMKLDSAFLDLGFLDATAVEWVDDGGTRALKRRNIGPFTRMEFGGDSLQIAFDCDSVFLYDDRAGTMDQVIEAKRLRYTWTPHEGLVLWLDGQKRQAATPL
ncbi:MAG: hypothetical protein IPF41_07815 [Flavobacteriales bacterium]|nr:hypothetical protein [Flavobacteriales bacterium]